MIARTSSAILSTCPHHSYFLTFSFSIGRILGNFSVSISSLYLQMLALRCQVYAYQVEHKVFLQAHRAMNEVMRWKETAAPSAWEYHAVGRCHKICSFSLKLLRWKSEITESCLQLHLMISWMSLIHRKLLYISSFGFGSFPGVRSLFGLWICRESTGRTVPADENFSSPVLQFLMEINSSCSVSNSHKSA